MRRGRGCGGRITIGIGAIRNCRGRRLRHRVGTHPAPLVVPWAHRNALDVRRINGGERKDIVRHTEELRDVVWVVRARELEVEGALRMKHLMLMRIMAKGAHQLGLRGTIVVVFIVVSHLSCRIWCESRRDLPYRRGTPTNIWTGRGSLGDTVADTSCIVPRPFTNDVGLHRDGTWRAM